jgi:putative tributyrin esterase
MTKFKAALSIAVTVCCLIVSCTKQATAPVDRPRLTPNVRLQDVDLHSASLNRDILYRVILPALIPTGRKLPVVYLLHGGAGSYRDWSNYTEVARYAEQGLVLVMPEGENSYYTNAVERPDDRYEDYVVKDLIADVEARFPVVADRRSRSIVGVSMGGYGGIKIVLKHPELYGFAAGLSSALDVPSRPFSMKRLSQWRGHAQIFGPWGSQTRHDNDPFLLVRAANPAAIPYIFLACGDGEGLLGPNRKFADLLKQRGYQYEFHTVSGGNHDWNNWSSQLPAVFASLALRQHSEPQ